MPGLDAKITEHLQCPVCRAQLSVKIENRLLACDKDHEFAINDGIIDLAPGYNKAATTAQALMQAEFFVPLYEDYWRPFLTWLGSGLDYKTEEQYLIDRKPGRAEVIIDIASGTGRFSRLLAREFRKAVVYAVDLSEAMLKKSVEICQKEQINNIVHIKGDAMNLPFKDAVADWLNCYGALYLLPETDRALKVFAEKIKTDGTFTALTSREGDQSLVHHLGRALFTGNGFVFQKENELVSELKEAGFKKSDLEPHNLMQFIHSIKTA